MVEASGNAQETETGIDFEAIENEIDREIDSLFIPTSKAEFTAPAPADHLKAQPAKPADGNMAAPRGASAAGSPLEGFDQEAFNSEIDREIDSLFTPASLQAAMNEAGEEARLAPKAAGESAGDPHARAAAFEPQTDHFPSGPPPGFRTGYAAREELPKLVEVFNAAYLSLDWEFSLQNIRKLESALSDLEPFAGSAPKSGPIFKMLKAILSRLSVRPQSVNNRIIELIRESQGLLAHILLMEGSPGENEEERLMSLLGRFRRMRDKALAARASRSLAEKQRSTEEQASLNPTKSADGTESLHFASHGAWPQFGYEQAAPLTGKIPDRWSLLELRKWMESTGRFLVETIDGFESEIRRIRQVETALEKSRGLSPVVARLADIRSGMERRVHALREREGGWDSRTTWVESMEKVSSSYESQRGEAPENAPEPVAEKAEVRPLPGTAEAEAKHSAGDQVRREDVCLFRYSGRSYAVFFSNVVKYGRISRKTAGKIQARGYATLDDVRPFWRSISKGVLGEWAAMPRKALQSLEFDLVSPSVFQADAIPADLQMAIFTNLGEGWGVILSDSDKIDFMADAEITEEACSCHSALGTVRTGSGLCAEVLDPGRLLPFPEAGVEEP